MLKYYKAHMFHYYIYYRIIFTGALMFQSHFIYLSRLIYSVYIYIYLYFVHKICASSLYSQ